MLWPNFEEIVMSWVKSCYGIETDRCELPFNLTKQNPHLQTKGVCESAQDLLQSIVVGRSLCEKAELKETEERQESFRVEERERGLPKEQLKAQRNLGRGFWVRCK